MPQPHRESWKETEAELFRLLVENVKDYAIFIVDSDRHVLSWSKGAERLLAFTEQEIIGQQCDSFFTPEDARSGAPQKELEQALQTGRGEDDRWHMRKDGSRFWCSGVVTPLRDECGNLRGFAKIMRDRTDLKRAEEAMQRVDRRRDPRLAITQILAEADSVDPSYTPVHLSEPLLGRGRSVGRGPADQPASLPSRLPLRPGLGRGVCGSDSHRRLLARRGPAGAALAQRQAAVDR